MRLNHIAVYAAKPQSSAVVLMNQRNKIFIYLAGQHHLSDFGGFFICYAQAADEFGFFTHAGKGFADFRAATVHQDNLDAD